jgi:hypothetical protein
MKTWSLLFLLLLLTPAARAGDDDLVVIRAGRVVTVSGAEHAPGTVVIRGGKVEAVGPRVEVPGRARVLDYPDGTLIPGLVLARTRLGLPGYDRAGNQAHLSAAPELSQLDPSAATALLARGVVLAGVIPAGGGIPGQAAAYRPGFGVVAGGGYLRVRFTDLPDDKRVLREALRAAQTAIDKETAARADFEKKRAGAAAAPGQPGAAVAPVDTSAKFEPPPVAEPLRPWVALLKKDPAAPRLLVELGFAATWVHLEEGFEKHPLFARVSLGNGASTDLDRVLDRIVAKKPLALCLSRLSFEANTRTRRNLPAELARGGAKVALLPPSDDDDGLGDWLAVVALLVRDGLSRVDALKAMTLHPAELLGLEAETGSIEAGKRADLVVLSGDPFEVGTEPVATLMGGALVWEKTLGAGAASDEDEEGAWR